MLVDGNHDSVAAFAILVGPYWYVRTTRKRVVVQRRLAGARLWSREDLARRSLERVRRRAVQARGRVSLAVVELSREVRA